MFYAQSTIMVESGQHREGSCDNKTKRVDFWIRCSVGRDEQVLASSAASDQTI